MHLSICNSPCKSELKPSISSIASQIGPQDRKKLAVKVIAKTQPISHLAKENGVSRKFLYQQAAKADDMLDQAFTEKSDDEEVLFYLPVTKAWLRQLVLALVLALVLICHSSLRGSLNSFMISLI